jgi:DNA-binding transcriptional ArsR family regulator
MHALDALGNPTRREILNALRERPLAVHELTARFSVSRPAVSRHLRLLEEAGLVQARESGAKNVYSVRLQGFDSVREYIDSFWDVALMRLSLLTAAEKGREK